MGKIQIFVSHAIETKPNVGFREEGRLDKKTFARRVEDELGLEMDPRVLEDKYSHYHKDAGSS